MSKEFFDPDGTSVYAFAVAVWRNPMALAAVIAGVVFLILALTA